MRGRLTILLIFWGLCLAAQDEASVYRVNRYNYIRYDLNKLHNFGNDRFSERFFAKLETMIRTGEGRINVIQIGGSHIQAGSFSGRIRNRLQQMNGEMNAGWGYMFPYRISRTNSPYGYYIRYSGYWQSCRNIEKSRKCSLGVGGIAATTRNTNAELTILLEKENQLDYRFSRVKIFHENGGDYTIDTDTSLVKNRIVKEGILELELNRAVDSLKIILRKDKNNPGSFTLHGITTESGPNGILYHSLGVNGAHVPAFLRCQLLEEQMAEMQPDLVILGLGINDAYGRRFSQKRFEGNYSELIEKIRKASPETAIILTTNNDSYLYRRYVNKNGEKVRESMFELAEEHSIGVWDMYTVMGGLNSIVLWEKSHLAQRDKIHFTREGYLLLGDLFFNAMLNEFESFLRQKNTLTELNNL